MLLALAPSAAALPIHEEVAVGPDGLEGPADAYFLKVVVTDPQPPSEVPAGQESQYDCADGNHPTDAADAAHRLADPVVAYLVDEGNSFTPSVHGFFPTCIAGPDVCVPAALCAPYVAYNVTSGVYFVGDPYEGSTGVGVLADCEQCPPPACC